MDQLLKCKIIDKNILGFKLNEFISDSQYNINTTLKSIFSLLYTLKNENDQIISKSKLIKYIIL